MLGILRRFHTKRRVAACAAAARQVIVLLRFDRQREEIAERVIGALDQPGSYAVTADATEAELAIGGAKFGDEGLAIAIESANIEGWNMLAHGRTR